MTGFGRAEHATKNTVARVEVSSVNRKQGEVVIQLPRAHAELEASLRKDVMERLSRGRVHVSIQIEKPDEVTGAMRINTSLARALETAFGQLSEAIDREVKPSSADFLRVSDILQFDDETVNTDHALEAIKPALETALDQMIAMRAQEGKHLQDDIEARIATLEAAAGEIATHAPSVLLRHRENLHRRLTESGLEINLEDERIIKEIALFADRCDITEEITRLGSHFEKFRSLLAADEPVGRPLDFLCQELNREFNTIGSKANDATLAQLIVHAKTELEKIREQVQNIE